MEKITSKIIGDLFQDSFDDWWKSKPVFIPYFNVNLEIIFIDFAPNEDVNFIEEADVALSDFLNLSENNRNEISVLVHKNCTDFLDMVEYDEFDEPLHQIKDSNEIWNFVQPNQIYVSRRHRRDKDVYIQVSCSCDWEQEHGLQLVFRQGKKITRISDEDGHLTEADAYDKPDSDDELLSKF